MTERQEVLKRMKKIEDYFQQNSLNNILFEPEFQCAKKIREKIAVLGQLTIKDVEDILKIYNEANAGRHHRGSGWIDYQLHLRHLFNIDDLKVDVDDLSGRMRINAG
jgi:hypothetical protein